MFVLRSIHNTYTIESLINRRYLTGSNLYRNLFKVSFENNILPIFLCYLFALLFGMIGTYIYFILANMTYFHNW